jgi:hypothetical protein
MVAGVDDALIQSKQLGGTSMDTPVYKDVPGNTRLAIKVNYSLLVTKALALSAVCVLGLWPVVLAYYFFRDVFELREEHV